jgi:hypothetical protein
MVSQLITLYVTPVIYLYLEQFQDRVLDHTSFFRSGLRRPARAGLDAGGGRALPAASPVAGGSGESDDGRSA